MGASPVAVAIDVADLQALVANAGGNDVTLLDISVSPPNVLGTISIFSQPTGIAFDPLNKVLVVTASLNNTLFFVNPATNLTSSARIGINPSSIAFNYLTNTIVTVNNASGTVSVMDANTRTTVGNLAITGAFLGSVAIVPNTNLCLIVDQVTTGCCWCRCRISGSWKKLERSRLDPVHFWRVLSIRFCWNLSICFCNSFYCRNSFL